MTLFWHRTTFYHLNAYISPKEKIRRKNIVHQFEWPYKILKMFTLGNIKFVLKDLHRFCLHLPVLFLSQPFNLFLHCLISLGKIFYVKFYKNSIKNLQGFIMRRRFSTGQRAQCCFPWIFSRYLLHVLSEKSYFLLKLQLKHKWKPSHLFQLKLVEILEMLGSNLREHRTNKPRK